MTLLAFVSAVFALLIAPGPTNTLMGVVGARQGWRGVVQVLPAELLGYLTTIVPLVWVGAELLAQWPAAATALKVLAALWVMFVATRLWGRVPMHATAAPVDARRIYVTTMLNPKALVFGLVLLPGPSDPQFALRFGVFCAMVSSVALMWGIAGAMTQVGDGGARRLFVIQRVASVWLAFISVTLMAGVVWPR